MFPLLLLACDGGKPPSDTEEPSETANADDTGESSGETDPAETAAAEGWCGVDAILARSCVGCHSGSGGAGGLDLATDPWGALVDQPSASYAGRVLVLPGDPDGSFLVNKVEGTQGDAGGPMPPSESLDAADQAAIRAWIVEGATQECADPETGVEPERHHPTGFAEPTVHGLAAKLQAEECVDCHGADLTGGSVGVSCDTCHTAGWRTACTRCHGGEETSDGAPPGDIDDGSDLSFPEHLVHVSETIHAAWDCVQCHQRPVDVLTPGHLFVDDATAAVAEVIFSGGLSPAGTYSAGSCGNLYCHGNGQAGIRGDATSGETRDCAMCHGDRSAAGRLSGEHEDHIRHGLTCGECHGGVVSGWDTVIDPTRHVDTTVDLDLPSTVTRRGDECTGACHGEKHNGSDWD